MNSYHQMNIIIRSNENNDMYVCKLTSKCPSRFSVKYKSIMLLETIRQKRDQASCTDLKQIFEEGVSFRTTLTRFLSELPMQQNKSLHLLSQLSWYARITFLQAPNVHYFSQIHNLVKFIRQSFSILFISSYLFHLLLNLLSTFIYLLYLYCSIYDRQKDFKRRTKTRQSSTNYPVSSNMGIKISVEVDDNKSGVRSEIRIVSRKLLPLPPVSVSATASVVMQFTASRFRFPHAALIFLHFYPRSTRSVVCAPHRYHHRRQYAPI